MQCTSCRLDSDNLREYSRAIDLGSHRKTIETIFLCPACRVFNAINPKFVMRRTDRLRSLDFAAGETDDRTQRSEHHIAIGIA